MQEAEKICKLKAYAQAVLAAVEGEPAVTEPAVERLFQEIRSAAQETVRRAGSPVKSASWASLTPASRCS